MWDQIACYSDAPYSQSICWRRFKLVAFVMRISNHIVSIVQNTIYLNVFKFYDARCVTQTRRVRFPTYCNLNCVSVSACVIKWECVNVRARWKWETDTVIIYLDIAGIYSRVCLRPSDELTCEVSSNKVKGGDTCLIDSTNYILAYT